MDVEFEELDLDREQEHEEEEMNNDLSSELDEENDDEEEQRLNNEIKVIKDAISLNAFDYDSHLKLIELTKKAGDLNELRLARIQMSSIYPLTPALWLDWLSNEIEFKENDQANQRILELFEKAIDDYVSLEIWLKYQQFILDILQNILQDENVDVNKIFERALASVGLHPTKGHLIWEIYRVYEQTLVDFEDDKEKQLKRVFNLFKRQLSIPNINLDTTYKEFKQWIANANDLYPTVKFDCSNIDNLFKRSNDEMNKILPFEEKLNCDAPELASYYAYLDYELKQKNPSRIKFLFERAITDHCLISELWIKYLNYLKANLNFDCEIIPILKRATRNVVWCAEIWIEYLRTLERFERPEEEVKEIFEKALTASFQTEDDYRKIWQCYLEFKRRKTVFNEPKQIELLRKNFEACIQHLASMHNADPYFTILIYQAKIEAKFCSNIAKSREIWEQIMSFHASLDDKQVNYWLEYANLEKLFGNQESYKKVMLKALNYCPENFDILNEQLMSYLKEESSSIKEIDMVEKSVSSIFERIVKKYREKLEESKGVKRKATADNIISPTSKLDHPKSSNKKFKNEASTSRQQDRLSNESVKSSNDSSSSRTFPRKPESDESRLYTVFVANLSFDLTEDRIKQEFSKFGNIKEVRLIRKGHNAKSKGFCYIEFSSIEDVKNALKNDRMPIDGRPAFISEVKNEKNDKPKEFKYETSLETNKLFVKNIASKVTQSRLEEIYGKLDGFKEVRLITFRNGHSKGTAYIEFKSSRDASKALLVTDGIELEKKKISVAISNPPQKKDKNERALGDAALFKKPILG